MIDLSSLRNFEMIYSDFIKYNIILVGLWTFCLSDKDMRLCMLT